MIYVGLDDTDVIDSPGTNQLAKALVAKVADRFECGLILRHQLLDDPRVPYTSKNGSASISLKPLKEPDSAKPADELCRMIFHEFRQEMQRWFVLGSDPGLCVTARVPATVTQFGRQCQRELTRQAAARQLAAKEQILLEGLGGTEDGVIGALAAVGLAAEGNDGRVVKLGTWPDDLSGPQPLEAVTARQVFVRDIDTERSIVSGTIDVGKHLRPNYRKRQVVLFARQTADESTWEAVRLT